METKLARISQLSAEHPEQGFKFTSIGHLINKELLRECHEDMDGKKAVGVDGVGKAEYSEKLDENLDKLVERLKRKSYKPKPARRVEIPKDNRKMRPLSIYSYEDKLVQEALRQILEAVFEPIFYDEMNGFRPDRNCHLALKKLEDMIMGEKVNWILDADIKGFFDHINHEWLIKFVQSRISDPNIIRLIRRMLKSGILKDGIYEETEEGSGQGSVCSPILANLYMHYVLIWWFNERIKPSLQGYGGLVVYADDFVVCFQYRSEAERFLERLRIRLKTFGLELEDSKTRLIEFGRFAERNRRERGEGKPETFTFLGFTHYCGTSRSGRFIVKRKTSKKKFSKKVKETHAKIRDMRDLPLGIVINKINSLFIGYYRYYGITGNSGRCSAFRYQVLKSLFYWINRRSQKSSYNWAQFLNMLKSAYPLVKPKIHPLLC